MEDYILAHISPEPEALRRIYRDTHLHHLYPRMCCGHLQGRLLAMLAAIARPRRILELGAYTGYATLSLAEGMPAGAEIHSVEVDDEKEELLLRAFAASPRAADIHLHIGSALTVVPELGGEWDLALIDANKREYAAYYRMLLPRLRPGGLMLADNTLWGGKLEDGLDEHADAQTRGVALFNDLVAADPRVEVVILPIRDGLTLIRKKETAEQGD